MAGSKQQIRFCRAKDGAQIAMAVMGEGPPLLRAAHWLSHVEFDARSPVWAHWLRELSRDHTYIRYDQRGCGLSDLSPPSMSFDAWVDDLEATVDALGLDRFPVFGMSQGGAIAIAYAARHPEKVSHLVLLGAYGRGRLRRSVTDQQRQEAEILLDLVRIGWGRDNPAFRQLFTTMFIPDGTREQHEWFNELERISASPENAASILAATYQIDVLSLAKTLNVPTLVCHARDDARVPFEEGRNLAAAIPSARFMPLESRNHVLLETEPAWPIFLGELRSFLASAGNRADSDAAPVRRAKIPSLAMAGLTPSEHDVLLLIAQGINNDAIATSLAKSEKTVRNQITSIFSKLGVSTRAEAIVRARDAGILDSGTLRPNS